MWRIVVPRQRNEHILRLYHEQMGDFDLKITFKTINKQLYWPQIRRIMHDYLSNCAANIESKPYLIGIQRYTLLVNFRDHRDLLIYY